MGLITKGMGVILKHAKKGKKAKLITAGKVKKGVDIKQFKKSKKHGLVKKLDVWANRESGKIFSQVGSGVNIKYTKKGKPFVPKGTRSSILTRAKGTAKLVSPIAAAGTAATIHDKVKGKK